ncbi:hypothetical protein ACFLU5_11410 [Bacteroidota bacterium]
MKPVLRSAIVLSLIVLFAHCEKEEISSNLSNLNEPYFTITDRAFFDALIEEGVDTDGDGLISNSEAEAIDSLYVAGGYSMSGTFRIGIKDLTGIEAFINLESLKCYDNYLTSLDLSNCVKLRELRCYNNLLTSLDISGCNSLRIVDCEHQQILRLDVSDCVSLKDLACEGNHLTSLNISKNTVLEALDCGLNPISFLDISENELLKVLRIDNMSLLNKVCVWELPFPPAGVDLNKTDSPNVYFTTECSD